VLSCENIGPKMS